MSGLWVGAMDGYDGLVLLPHPAWLTDCIPSIWRLFVSKFSALWKASGFDGDLYPELVLGPSAPAGTHSLSECQEAFFSRLFVSTLGFAGEAY